MPEINHPFTPPCTVWTNTFDFHKLALCMTRFRVNTHKNGELWQSDAVPHGTATGDYQLYAHGVCCLAGLLACVLVGHRQVKQAKAAPIIPNF